MTKQNDPYQLRPEEVEEPPQTFSDSLKRIGPGIILAASIVGSGELIATTTLGAQVGYTALWVIVFCAIATFVILRVIAIFVPLRMSEKDMEEGDLAVHCHEVYPSDVPSLGFPHGASGYVPAPTATPAESPG